MTESENRGKNAPGSKESVATASLFNKATELVNKYSQPFFNPLLKRHGVEMMPSQQTTPVRIRFKSGEVIGDLSIIRQLPDVNSYSHVISLQRTDRLIALFQLKQDSILNCFGHEASNQEVEVAKELIDLIDEHYNPQVSRSQRILSPYFQSIFQLRQS